MTFTIDLPSETEKRLRESAARVGQRPEDFARHLVESGLSLSLEDDLERFRKAILAKGETEEETGKFFQDLVDEARARQS